MEIKTLEHYAIAKLEEKDRRIEELEREQDKLMAKVDELTQEHQTMVQNLKKFGLGEGRTGGFVQLSSADIAEIYKIAAKASVVE